MRISVQDSKLQSWIHGYLRPVSPVGEVGQGNGSAELHERGFLFCVRLTAAPQIAMARTAAGTARFRERTGAARGRPIMAGMAMRMRMN